MSDSRDSSAKLLFSIVLILALLAMLALLFTALGPYSRAVVGYYLSPSAEEALALGQMHFSSRHPVLYDIDKADAYITSAFRRNPKLLHVNHELARIAFLRGDFDLAMTHINSEISMYGKVFPNAYYIRGLIQGYRGEYDAAAEDYRRYLASDASNWAALNDYAWVLLKAGRAEEALAATTKGLAFFPNNPWLLNSHAIALYDVGEYEAAHFAASIALEAANSVTEDQWLTAYPGNDPKVAAQGIVALRAAIERNIHMATDALSNNALQ